jgi:D-arginine dehydrogenase
VTTQRSDFLILGGGIAGASAGFFLAGRGTVTLLETEDTPGYHATGRSAALFTEYYGNACIRALTRASRAFFENPPPGFAEHPLLTPRGVVAVARDDDEAEFEAALERGRAISPLTREIDAAEVARLCPIVRPGSFARALHRPIVMDVDVHAAHSGFLRGLRAHGGRVVTSAPARAIGREDGVWLVETPVGRFAAPILVNAAGAWADEVAAMAGVAAIGLVAMRRTAITFDPPAGLDPSGWPMVTDIGESIYVKPEGGRLLASPCDETPVPPSDVQPDEIDVATAADRVGTLTTVAIRRIVHKWAGLRSFVADRTVVVGEAPDAPGFFWLAGQGGYGVQTAPAVARAAAALATGEPLPDEVACLGITAADLSPARLISGRAQRQDHDRDGT